MKSSKQKIFLDQQVDITTIAKHLSRVPEKEIIFNFPRGARFASSLDNFRALKKRADSLGKKVLIESIDERALEMASSTGFDTLNPIFQTDPKTVRDIIPKTTSKPEGFRTLPVRLSSRTSSSVSSESQEKASFWRKKASPAPLPTNRLPSFLSDDAVTDSESSAPVVSKKPSKPLLFPKNADSGFGIPSKKTGRFRGGKFAMSFFLLGGLIFLGVGVWVLVAVLPKATVKLVFKEYLMPFQYQLRVDTGVSTSSIQEGALVLPGELLKASKNLQMSFPANGTDKVEVKAKGRLTIYNAFSSEAQALVERTRFETSDGRVFRLIEGVTVPGAKIVDGKIEPSTLEVSVQADQAGVEYNIPAVPKFTIPGFKGTPRFEGFYGVSKEPMTGGFVGVQAVATDEDVVAAKKSLRETLLSSLKGELGILMKENYDVLEGSTAFDVVKEEVEQPAPLEKTFKLYMEARFRQFVFDRTSLEDAITKDAIRELDAGFLLAVKKISVQYFDPLLDFSKEQLQVRAEGEIAFRADINVGDLKKEFFGKDAESAKKIIFQLPGLERAT